MTAENSLHTLADYPVLATLAKGRTAATKLDGRACRFLYIEAISLIDEALLSDKEKALMQSLGVGVLDDLGGLQMLKDRQRKDSEEVAAGLRSARSLLMFQKGDLEGITPNPNSKYNKPGEGW